tara:strand:+ start:8651 stop:9664 length:1014 start_codon:yes stop_codon:yes gene_type:complete
MNFYREKLEELSEDPKIWLVTGVAGFIGSNILETLLKNNQIVFGIDNFVTGHENNLLKVKDVLKDHQWNKFNFHEGDILNFNEVSKVCKGVDFVLHQAALGSVPRSIEDPITSNEINVNGFLNVIKASQEAKVKKFIFASSSSIYGDQPDLPKKEKIIGNQLSPYALTKMINEMYSEIFELNYSFNSVGLRYFNIFGKRQDPSGPYAAVIPKWIANALSEKPLEIYGDGQNSRDFCFIENAVQANILSALSSFNNTKIFNVAVGERTKLIDLATLIKLNLERQLELNIQINHLETRKGDVLHSQADITRISKELNYQPSHTLKEGLDETIKWYLQEY